MLLRTAELNYAPVAGSRSGKPGAFLMGGSFVDFGVGWSVNIGRLQLGHFCPSLLESELERIRHHRLL